MPTIIDSLLVTLGLDPAPFKKGTQEADEALEKTRKGSQRAGKDIEEATKKGGEGMAMLRNEVMRLGAAFVGLSAIKAFVEGTTRADAATGRMAKTLDMNIQGLSQWKQVAEQFGVSGDAVASDMDRFAQSMEDFNHGLGGESVRYFRALNIETADAKGNLRDAREVMLDVADALQKLKPTEAKFYGTHMGYSADTVSLMLRGRKALQDALNADKNTALSDADVKAAEARQKAWTKLDQEFGRINRNILNDLTPTMTKFMDFVTSHGPEVELALGAITASMTAIGAMRFVGTISSLAKLAEGLRGVSAAAGLAGAGEAGAVAGAAGRLGMLAKGGGLVGSIAFTGYELYKLGDDLWNLINTREGVKLTPHAIEGLAKMNAAGGSSGPLPRGIRNNNPGNLEFANQPGAVHEQGGGGRFAAFGSMTEGLAALADQLERYAARGNDTLAGMISTFAPPGENNTGAYIANLAKALGVSPAAHLNLENDNVLRTLMLGIANVENGPGMLQVDQINAGIDLHRHRAGQVVSHSNETTIQNMTVVTRATDARGIANDMQPALLAAQSNVGLQ
jgi:hypothetical protein